MHRGVIRVSAQFSLCSFFEFAVDRVKQYRQSIGISRLHLFVQFILYCNPMGLAQSVILGNWACPDEVSGINNQSLYLTRGRTGQLSGIDQALSQSLTKITSPRRILYTRTMVEKEETSFELSEFKLSSEAKGYKTKEMNYSFLNLNATPLIHGVKLNN